MHTILAQTLFIFAVSIWTRQKGRAISMDVLAIAFGVVGGLAVFLFGLYMLSDGLKKVIGEKLKQLLTKATNNPLKGAFLGAITAATVHSGLTMVILMGLLNAGALTLTQNAWKRNWRHDNCPASSL